MNNTLRKPTMNMSEQNSFSHIGVFVNICHFSFCYDVPLH